MSGPTVDVTAEELWKVEYLRSTGTWRVAVWDNKFVSLENTASKMSGTGRDESMLADGEASEVGDHHRERATPPRLNDSVSLSAELLNAESITAFFEENSSYKDERVRDSYDVQGDEKR